MTKSGNGRSVSLAALRRRRVVAALLVVLAGFGVATVRWFVMPPQGMPGHVDAIVMLNGPGDRLDTALKLAWAHRAPVAWCSSWSMNGTLQQTP